jgi:hypothetical protein
MFRLYLSHLQALKGQIHTINKQCIVGSQTLTIIRLYNKEILRMAVLLVTDNAYGGFTCATENFFGIRTYLICI